MTELRVGHRRSRRRALGILGAAAMAFALAPVTSLAQTTVQPVVYARTDLNLRKGPGSQDAIYMVIPLGAEVHRRAGEITNDYAPVTYRGTEGWVVALGLVSTPSEIGLAPVEETPPEETLSLYEQGVRVTLTPLMLRSGPSLEAEPITGMPEGSLVTLTREGWDNGYVTVDYVGAQGWAYADLLGPPTGI